MRRYPYPKEGLNTGPGETARYARHNQGTVNKPTEGLLLFLFHMGIPIDVLQEAYVKIWNR